MTWKELRKARAAAGVAARAATSGASCRPGGESYAMLRRAHPAVADELDASTSSSSAMAASRGLAVPAVRTPPAQAPHVDIWQGRCPVDSQTAGSRLGLSRAAVRRSLCAGPALAGMTPRNSTPEAAATCARHEPRSIAPCPTTPSVISSASPPSAKAMGRPSAASSTAARRGSPLDRGGDPADLDRRRPGQSRFTTQRREPDAVRILSGVVRGRATAAGHHRHADRAA